MKKILFLTLFALSTLTVSNTTLANHCSGGHKEIKDTKDTSTEESKETKSN